MMTDADAIIRLIYEQKEAAKATVALTKLHPVSIVSIEINAVANAMEDLYNKIVDTPDAVPESAFYN